MSEPIRIACTGSEKLDTLCACQDQHMCTDMDTPALHRDLPPDSQDPADRMWRKAMRSMMWLELPDRRPSGHMRDLPIGRLENATWRTWAQELTSESGAKQRSRQGLEQKLQALRGTSCLLCGDGRPCTCFNADASSMESEEIAPR